MSSDDEQDIDAWALSRNTGGTVTLFPTVDSTQSEIDHWVGGYLAGRFPGAREYTTSPFVTSTLPELAYDEEGFIERGVRACSDIIGGSDTVREDCSLWLAEGWRTLTEEQRDQPSDEWEDLMGSPGTLASHLGSPSSIEGVRFLALLEEYDRRYSELLEIPGFRIWEEDEGSDSSLEFVNSPVYNRRKRKVKFAKENFRSEFDELRSNYIAGGWPVNEPEVEYSRRSSGCNVQ